MITYNIPGTDKNKSSFLEKFIAVSTFNFIKELDIKDLYENLSLFKQRGIVDTNLDFFETADTLDFLEIQLLDMIEKEEIYFYNEFLIITLSEKRREEILYSMNDLERHQYYTLVKMYIQENMKKSQRQKRIN